MTCPLCPRRVANTPPSVVCRQLDPKAQYWRKVEVGEGYLQCPRGRRLSRRRTQKRLLRTTHSKSLIGSRLLRRRLSALLSVEPYGALGLGCCRVSLTPIERIQTFLMSSGTAHGGLPRRPQLLLSHDGQTSLPQWPTVAHSGCKPDPEENGRVGKGSRVGRSACTWGNLPRPPRDAGRKACKVLCHPRISLTARAGRMDRLGVRSAAAFQTNSTQTLPLAGHWAGSGRLSCTTVDAGSSQVTVISRHWTMVDPTCARNLGRAGGRRSVPRCPHFRIPIHGTTARPRDTGPRY